MSISSSVGFGIGYSNTREGANPETYAPYPAPNGYRWDFVTFKNERVTFIGEPIVALIGV